MRCAEGLPSSGREGLEGWAAGSSSRLAPSAAVCVANAAATTR